MYSRCVVRLLASVHYSDQHEVPTGNALQSSRLTELQLCSIPMIRFVGIGRLSPTGSLFHRSTLALIDGLQNTNATLKVTSLERTASDGF